MTTTSLADKSCKPCHGDGNLLVKEEQAKLLTALHEDWRIDTAGKTLSRRFTFKGFAKATYLTNLCVWLADREGHHPDMALGWGYALVTLTTHDADGLTENDFIWAAKLDRLLAI